MPRISSLRNPLLVGEGMGVRFTVTIPTSYTATGKTVALRVYDGVAGTLVWDKEQAMDDTVFSESSGIVTTAILEATAADTASGTPAWSTLANTDYAFAWEIGDGTTPDYRIQGILRKADGEGPFAPVVEDAPYAVTFSDGITLQLSGPTVTGTGSGDVVGPSSATNNAFARFDTTTGKLIQDGTTTEDDSGNVTVTGNISVTGTVDGRDVATDGTKLDGVEALADVTDATNVASAGAAMTTTYDPAGAAAQVKVIGKETIFVPAAAMRPTSSNGCAAITDVETTAGRPDLQVLDFDATADEHAQFQVAFPKSWDEGTVTFQAYWTSAATDTDGVAWALQGVYVANDGTIDVAYGTAVVVTDDNLSAAEDLLVTAESSAITIAGTPAEGGMCFFRVFRDVSDANDDMTEDARLIGIKLYFTTDAANDA